MNQARQAIEALFSAPRREIIGTQRDVTGFLSTNLIGASRWSAQTRSQIAAHAAHNNAVILTGEPGTGKEFLGRLIHRCSERSTGPFVAITFDSVSDESAETALFGSLNVLPTGARHIHRGLVEEAEGGVVFIADASKLSFPLRAKISRLIQHGEFKRLNDSTVRRSDVRVMLGSTTELDIALDKEWTLVGNSARANTLSIEPLRDRKDDIEPLIRHFIKRACEHAGREVREVTPDAIEALSHYHWPCNVAELKSVAEQLVQRCGPPTIGASLLPGYIAEGHDLGRVKLPSSGFDLLNEVREFEKAILCSALKQCHGVQNKAARLLGLKPTTLNMKLKMYGIEAGAFK